MWTTPRFPEPCKHTVSDMCNQVFCPPLKFEFQPYMGDEVQASPMVSSCWRLLPSSAGAPRVLGEENVSSEAWGQVLAKWASPAEEFTTNPLICASSPPACRTAEP